MFSPDIRFCYTNCIHGEFSCLGLPFCARPGPRGRQGPAAESKADAAQAGENGVEEGLAAKKVLTAEQTALHDRTRETLAMLRHSPLAPATIRPRT